MKSIMKTVFIVFCLLGDRGFAAELRFARVFNDHMVLQRDVPVPVWGWTGPGSKVTVTFAGQTQTAMADGKGKWLVRLGPLTSTHGNTGGELTVAASVGKVTIKDVLVGDVWVCGGQSNMAFGLGRATGGTDAIANANHPLIRLCDVTGKSTRREDPYPDDLESARWEICSPTTVSNFSAVAYYFGRDLQPALGVPVGLIDVSVGGTGMRSWMRRQTMESDPDLREQVIRHDDEVKRYPQLMEKYNKQLAEYENRLAKAKAGDRALPEKESMPPVKPKDLDSSYRLAYFYASMVCPLQPYAMKGVIWYQGEANAGNYASFRKQFTALINEWRRDWGQDAFPWLYVQLPPYADRIGGYYPRVWEAQSQVLSVKNTAMVVGLDVGAPHDIHPPNKEPIGARLALAARGMVYGEKVVWRSPMFQRMERRGSELVLNFEHIGGGLTARNGALNYFTIAGDDKNFKPATARIKGDAVVVSNPNVARPVTVRYGWYDKGEESGGSLFNREGLPVAPFRTDNWPDSNKGKRQ